MIRDLLKAFALSNALPIAGIVFALCVTGYGAYRVSVAHARSAGYSQGYAVARDSALEATILRMRDAESTYSRRADSLVRLAIAATPKHSTPAPPPIRLEPITASDSQLVPTVPIDRFVRVYVEKLQAAYLVEAPAAYAWKEEDDSVQAIVRERDSLKVSNKRFSEAFFAKDTSKSLADSSGYAERARDQMSAHPNKCRRIAWTVAGIVVGFIAAKRVH